MPIRNLFSRRSEVLSGSAQTNGCDKFEKVDTVGSRASSAAMSTSSNRNTEPAEYKMSVVNDSGVYLPPSPPEKKSFWPKRSPSAHPPPSRSSPAEIEPFSISRESFDSYRRSFDISARSPVVPQEPYIRGRHSLDTMTRLPRSAIGDRKFERQPPTAEEGFEEVGLNDENKPPAQNMQQAQKRKSFFSKFGDDLTPPASPNTSSRFHLPGRKRGQSGQGAELGEISRPGSEKAISTEGKGFPTEIKEV